ncbi:hypothetical protein OsJ_29477 [Oryza sativa Japonica Group]|uniref:Alanine aminotransferase 2 n=1 Tax=Oryza sativa subsp. japonica TaxID=39947 RepID=B9G3R8_ORYSJ|nr:hypothetical protein OsJ_29477 [Oryza sativa Japonica Group]
MSYNHSPSITAETINQKVRIFTYEPCGEIVRHARRLEKEIYENPGSLPFQEIIYCNLGNPQALGQRPINFFREVLSLCDNPSLIDRDEARALFSPCALKRARKIIESLPGRDSGSYTSSQGVRGLREAVADGIAARDGFPSKPDNIFLTDGASSAINMMMQILIRSHEDGILCPLPEYPLYSASIILHGGTMVPYNLTEDSIWGLEIFEVKRCLEDARASGLTIRAMVVINPGNPTGQVLSITNQEEIVEFCRKEGLVILADEVYQENVYTENKRFNSFKKVARSLGYDHHDLSIVSFHSVSMGYYGECGRRGGYMEICGFGDDVIDEMYKLASLTICPNIAGQILISLVMDPPKLGDEAFEIFIGREGRDLFISTQARKGQEQNTHISKFISDISNLHHTMSKTRICVLEKKSSSPTMINPRVSWFETSFRNFRNFGNPPPPPPASSYLAQNFRFFCRFL